MTKASTQITVFAFYVQVQLFTRVNGSLCASGKTEYQKTWFPIDRYVETNMEEEKKPH